ncbi:unnamed protein product, partial [Tetraodon nigroviridis]
TADYSTFPTVCVKELNRQFRRWFMPTFYSVIFFLGLAGNLLVILTFFYFKRLKTMTDVYLLNLSFADLLFALSLPFWAANTMTKWVLGEEMCIAMYTVYKVSFYSSMFLLCCISVDRYFAISKATSAYRYRSQTMFLSKVSSAVVWVAALIFSMPEMRYTSVNNNTCTPYTGSKDQLRVIIQVGQIVLAFALPLVIMSICYSSIIKTLCQAQNFERNKAIKVILAVVAVFLVSQVPYNLVLFWSTLVTAKGGTTSCSYDNNLLYATDVTQCLAFFRCCLNPIVYAFIGVKFRNDLLKLLKDWGCMSHESFFKYTSRRRRSSGFTETETTTTTISSPTMMPATEGMTHMIPNHVLRVGQTIRLDPATEASDRHDDSDRDHDISLEQLNRIILELDPTFEPLHLGRSPTQSTRPAAGNCCPDEDLHSMLIPRGCSTPSVMPSTSPSIPIPTRSGPSCSPPGTLVFSSSPGCSLPPLPFGSAPRRNLSPKSEAALFQGSLRLSQSNRNSVCSLLSMSTCSDTSYILGSNLSLASEEADSPDSILVRTCGSFSDGSRTRRCVPAHFTSTQPTMKFVMDTSKFWFRPHITRAEAEALVKDKEAGTFVVRDSTSYRGSFGLAMKVEPGSPEYFSFLTLTEPNSSELVRHFLIESSAKGVRVKGSSQEPYFGSLSALVYQHTISAYALPCKLVLHSKDASAAEWKANDKPASEDKSKLGGDFVSFFLEACNFVYLNAVPTEMLTGPCAVQKAVSFTLEAPASFRATTVNLKVSSKGVTLTDINRKLFFRRHYPAHLLSHSGEDPDNRLWVKGSCVGARMFGFVAKGVEAGVENVCHVFAEYDPLQPCDKVIEAVQ